MNIPIIASSFAGICTELRDLGYSSFRGIVWNRTPYRVNVVWHAEVRHG
jgi:hypothetical protein